NARPHPDPLPQEREQLSFVFNSANDYLVNPPSDTPQRWRPFLPLLGERAGVREVVISYFSLDSESTSPKDRGLRLASSLNPKLGALHFDRVNQSLIGELQRWNRRQTQKRKRHERRVEVAAQRAGRDVQICNAFDDFRQRPVGYQARDG